MAGDKHGAVADEIGRHIDHVYFITYRNIIYWAEKLGLRVVRSRAFWYRRFTPFRWLLEPFFKNFGEVYEILLVKGEDFRIPDDPNFRPVGKK